MGIINSTGCTSSGFHLSLQSLSFPWANISSRIRLDGDGIFEGHMAHMADGFKAVRMAEIELRDGYNKDKHENFFTYFDWKQFTDDELHLCPPVVSIGAMALCTISASRICRA